MAYVLAGIFVAAVCIFVLHRRRNEQEEYNSDLEDIRENPYDYAEEIRLLRCGQKKAARNSLMEDGYTYTEAQKAIRALKDLLDQGALDHYYQVDMEYVDRMSGMDFERFVANLLYRMGYQQVKLTPGSNDQGVDILAEWQGVRYAFQCKCYASPLNNKAIQEVTAGKVFWGCEKAVVVTNTYFNHNAIQVAELTGTELWDRDVLMKMIADTQ